MTAVNTAKRTTPSLQTAYMFRGFMPGCRELSALRDRERILTERAPYMVRALSESFGGSFIRISNPAIQPSAGNTTTRLFNEYLEERKKSSHITMTNMFAQVDGDIFQLMCKEKTRKDLKHVWEFVMMDYWRDLLTRYSQVCGISMSSPRPFWLEGNKLYMSRETGFISNKMHTHIALTGQAAPILPGEEPLRVYDSFALHLGALSRIKEREALLHGDYQLRHVLFSPKGIASHMLYPPGLLEHESASIAQIANRAFAPGIKVIDVEGSMLGLEKEDVLYENFLMHESACVNAKNNGGKVAASLADRYLRFYVRGRGLVPGDFPVQTPSIVSSQHEKWGFSVDVPL